MNKLEGGPIGKLKNSHRPKDRMKLASALSSYRFFSTLDNSDSACLMALLRVNMLDLEAEGCGFESRSGKLFRIELNAFPEKKV